jgi:hypothetical protein
LNTASGPHVQTLSNVLGCDSVVTLNLTINNSNTGSFTEVACNSYLWNNTTYTSSGQYQQTLQNQNGCDSVVTLNLTINNSNTGSFTEVACNSYFWNNLTYSTSGQYQQTLQNQNGCDSVVTLNLTINNSNTGSFTDVACNSYLWNNTTYTSSGQYQQTLQNQNGCDSVVTLNLTITTPTTWYLDADADGYHSQTQTTCSKPGTNWIATTNGLDCNDNDVNVWIATMWFKDGDSDGWYISQLSCSSPGAGWSTTPQTQLGDCNDANNTIYPSATEICGNGIDEDCNGSDLPCGGGNCNATVTLTSGGLNALWVNAGASAPNTFYYGVTDALRMNTAISGGVGPFTYSWSNSGTNFLLPRSYYPANSVDLFRPTGAITVTCTVTDQGTGCVYTVSLYMNWDNQFFCQVLNNTWYLNMCINGQNVCMPWAAARTVLRNNTGTMGSCIPAKVAGISNLALHVELFPNPNNGEFMLSVANAAGDLSLSLTDVNGKVLLNEKATSTEGQYYRTFDLRHLPPGMYFILVNDGQNLLTEKVVIRH